MRILVTGGCGFIGVNLCNFLCDEHELTIVDDLSRPGSKENANLLSSKGLHVDCVTVLDLLSSGNLDLREFESVIHLAGQVSLSASLLDPEVDFRSNLASTFALIEEIRKSKSSAFLIYSSTNKVYGDLANEASELPTRYHTEWINQGISESSAVQPIGPYSVSKYAAELYIRDYANLYGVPSVVLRKSAVAGRYQRPKSDQGWFAYLVQETVENNSIALNGVGKQVRDVLDVRDLVRLYAAVINARPRTGHHVYNVGGGPQRTLSLLELFEKLILRGYSPHFTTGDFLPGDQKVYVSDITRVAKDFGWSPIFDLEDTLTEVIDSVQSGHA